MKHTKQSFLMVLLAVITINLLFQNQQALSQGESITFSVTGDIPYDPVEIPIFETQMANHNLYSPSDFLVHVGDLNRSSESCQEVRYITVSNILQDLAVPAYIVPGDNEWPDCSDPAQGWQWWQENFSDFEQYFCGTPQIEHQAVRHENFAFVQKGVLFIGVNIPNGDLGSVELATRLQDDADWVDFQLTDKVSQVRGAVVFGHAGPASSRDLFFDQFSQSANNFVKPVLYAMGDKHTWDWDEQWIGPKIYRMTIARGGLEAPVQVTVTMDPDNMFQYIRDPWAGNSQPYNIKPCVEAGSNQIVSISQSANLAGAFADDGVPLSPGTVTVIWTQTSGPGAVIFGNANALNTTANFNQAGIYELTLTADDGELQGDDSQTVTVEGPEGPALSINDVTVTEGNAGTTTANFTVSLSSSRSQVVMVDYATSDGTATLGSDYQSMSGTVSLSPGTTIQTINVTVDGDFTEEDDETFFVDLSNVSNAAIVDNQGQGTILNDDGTPMLSIDDVSVSEGNSGSVTANFTISLSIASGQEINVDYQTSDGTAIAGSDYQSTSGTASFSPGTTTQIISVIVDGDFVDEDDETFFIDLSNASNAAIVDNQGQGTILNDDTDVDLDVNIALGKPITASSFRAENPPENGNDNNNRTHWRSRKVDLNNREEWLMVDLGSSVSIGLVIVRWYKTYYATEYEFETSNNATDWLTVFSTTGGQEGEQGFTVVANPARYVRLKMIRDNKLTYRLEEIEIYSGEDNGTLPTLTINDVSVTEGDAGTTTADFTVSLSSSSTEIVTADYTTSDGTAIAGSDYQSTSGTASFSPGTTTQVISVIVDGDLDDEGNETFFVDLSNVSNAIITDNQGQGTIFNDDSTPMLSIDDVSVSEGDAGTVTANFTISLAVANGQGINVDYQTSDGTAIVGSDYQATSGTASFSPGTTTQIVSVIVNGDLDDEGNETFFVDLSNASNAAIADNQGQGTILNDDANIDLDVNIALNQPITASSFRAENPPENGNDNNNRTHWRSRKVDPNNREEWLMVDLGSSVSVGLVIVQWYKTYHATEYEFQTSNNTTDWTTVFSTIGGQAGEQQFTVVADPARYVRLKMIRDNKSTYRIEEIEIYGGQNNGTTPTVTISDVNVNEGDAGSVTADFSINLSAAGEQNITVDYTTSNGTAIAGSDYQSTSGIASFPAGTTTQIISVIVNGDLDDEENEIFFVDLSNVSNAAIFDNQGQGTILNDDANIDLDVNIALGKTITASSFRAENPPENANDDNNRTHWRSRKVDLNNREEWLMVDLGSSISVGRVIVQWYKTYFATEYEFETSNNATDWTTVLSTTSGAEGEQEFTIVADPTRYFRLKMTRDNKLTYRLEEIEIYSEQNNSTMPALTIGDVSVNEGDVGSVTANFSINLSAASEQDVNVDYTTSDGTATVGSDYQAVSGTASFSPGTTTQIISVIVDGDLADEADETFFVDLSNAANTVITNNQGQCMIIDDDTDTNIDPDENIALDKPATASSSNSSKPPENANDGDDDKFWRSRSVDDDNPEEWLMLDLGSSISVGRVVIRWYKSYYAESYEFQTSNDAADWTTVFSNNDGKKGEQEFTVVTDPVRYVRLKMILNNKGTYRVEEIEIYRNSLSLTKSNTDTKFPTVVPNKVALGQNYPNPFNPTTTFSFSLREEGRVSLKIYNITGQVITTLVDGNRSSGVHKILFDASELPGGLYFYTLKTREKIETRKLILLK